MDRLFLLAESCAAHAQPFIEEGEVEVYFSIVQRKVVTPNDFTSLRELEDRLLAFQTRYEQTATPFQWTFTRADLTDVLERLKAKELGRAA